jgi:uroporphyrin-3 C-methyltransferase
MTDPDTPFDRDAPTTGRPWWRWLVVGLVMLALAVAAWLAIGKARDRAASESAAIVALRAELDDLRAALRAAEAARVAVERRVTGNEGVNRSLREEVLGVGERTRVLEDAVARLARRGLTGSTELKLNEAEFLLSMGEERLALFGDVAGALRAFDLADAELAALDDPVYAGVRQSLAVEREALRALPPADTAALYAELDALSDAIADLPAGIAPVAEGAPALAPEAGLAARIGSGLSRFIRIERTGTQARAWADPDAARLAAQVELLRAKSALALGDREGLAAAAGRAQAALDSARGRDASHDAVLERLDVLAATTTVELPPVGTALAQLRNLRATRSVAVPPPAADPVDESDASGDEDPAP